MPSFMQLLLAGAASYTAYLYIAKQRGDRIMVIPANAPQNSQVIMPVDNAANRAEMETDLAKYNQQMQMGQLGQFGMLGGAQFY